MVLIIAVGSMSFSDKKKDFQKYYIALYCDSCIESNVFCFLHSISIVVGWFFFVDNDNNDDDDDDKANCENLS